MFGVYLMIVFGLVGYFMKKFDYSFVTFVVGYVLGPMAELTIRQSLIISDSNPAVLVDHPIAVIFLLLAAFSIWKFASAGTRSMQAGQSKPVKRWPNGRRIIPKTRPQKKREKSDCKQTQGGKQ